MSASLEERLSRVEADLAALRAAHAEHRHEENAADGGAPFSTSTPRYPEADRVMTRNANAGLPGGLDLGDEK